MPPKSAELKNKVKLANLDHTSSKIEPSTGERSAELPEEEHGEWSEDAAQSTVSRNAQLEESQSKEESTEDASEDNGQ